MLGFKEKKENSLPDCELSCPHCGNKMLFREEEDKVICDNCGKEVEFEEAMENYRNATSASTAALMAPATELMEKGNFKEASIILEGAIKACPYSGRLHFALLLARYELGSPSQLKSIPYASLKDDLNFKCALAYLSKEDRDDLLSLLDRQVDVAFKEEKAEMKEEKAETEEETAESEIEVKAGEESRRSRNSFSRWTSLPISR